MKNTTMKLYSIIMNDININAYHRCLKMLYAHIHNIRTKLLTLS